MPRTESFIYCKLWMTYLDSNSNMYVLDICMSQFYNLCWNSIWINRLEKLVIVTGLYPYVKWFDIHFKQIYKYSLPFYIFHHHHELTITQSIMNLNSSIKNLQKQSKSILYSYFFSFSLLYEIFKFTAMIHLFIFANHLSNSFFI